MTLVMPRKSRLVLPPLDIGEETLGQRIARFRKERGYTQQELAEAIGIIQSLVSDYERGKLRLNAEMVIRFALALGLSADQLLGLEQRPPPETAPRTRRLKRRLRALEELPRRDQEALLRTIDAFLAKAS